MKEKDKTKKELMSELEKLRLQLEDFERSNENGSDISDETFRLIVESVPNGIIVSDDMGQIIFLNSQAEKMFAYERGALLGKSVEDLMPEGFRRGHIKYRSGYVKAPNTRSMGEGRDLFALRSDGSQFPVEIGLNFVKSDSELVVISTIIDITERRNTENLLNEREQRLRQIMDNTTDAIIVFDQKGVVETLNREARQLFCAGDKKQIDEIWEIITPESRESFSEKLNKVSEGKRITDYETERIGKGGKRISVSISLVYMNEGQGRFIETIRDISERIIMRNKIIELEKAQIIGKMAEGFAHHMGTPLASMLLRVQMLKEDIPDFPEYKDIGEKLSSIERQILYGQKVIHRLLRFVGRPGNEKSPENISNLLEESIEMIRPVLKKKGIVLETDKDENLQIFADTNLINLVFSDTMMNAVDAMPEGGVLSIITCKEEKSQSIKVQIRDTGVGISEETIPFVFEPFFTTKPAGKGTGLGLSVAKSIVHDHGGDISIESKQGKGTIVSISLPILNQEEIN
ncbi:MAG: sporulation kinase A [Thermodesulfobacteriota bacterium]|nr:MAG: sporulation kinase A [Thermodesulfobacteriota bacterium]